MAGSESSLGAGNSTQSLLAGVFGQHQVWKSSESESWDISEKETLPCTDSTECFCGRTARELGIGKRDQEGDETMKLSPPSKQKSLDFSVFELCYN